MSITSLYFPPFLALALAAYFLVPKKAQWAALLAFSAAFYVLTFGAWGYALVLTTAFSVWLAARRIQRISDDQRARLKAARDEWTRDEKSAFRSAQKKRRRRVLTGTLALNFGILCAFKYLNFALSLVSLPPLFKWAAPLGISFYTFQAVGYLVDVYWENERAEDSFPRFLLFVSFFPQITQGPISEHADLARSLRTPHSFDYERFARGCARVIWGFAKKMILANMLAPIVDDAFLRYADYAGLTVLLAAFGYSVRIYADFSGYMDIMCGFCEILGIRLAENFDRPYFSSSVAEYWRRWHMTLGAWFKKYVYYPIAVSRPAQRLGKRFSRTLPATVALAAVWFLTGLWHGASLTYLAWGGVNGCVIILSLWLEPVYARARAALGVREDGGLFRVFRVARTFLLVTLIKVLPEVGTLADGFGFVGRIFSGPFLPRSLDGLFPFTRNGAYLLCVFAFTALLFAVSWVSLRRDVRELFSRLPFPARILILSALIVLIFLFGVPVTKTGGGFMYAQF